MSVLYDSSTRTFTLNTQHTTYQMQISRVGHLLHLYYGSKTNGDRLDYQYILADRGFSPNSYEARLRRNVSMDLQPQEYSGENTGDFRISSVEVNTELGFYGTDLHYESHTISQEKYRIGGLPSSYAGEGEAETLTVVLKDAASGLKVELLYGVFAEKDVITRAARLVNESDCAINISKAASVCLDVPFGQWDLIHLQGRYAEERQMERVPLLNGIQTISSRRGASSHHHNPFVILCDNSATEDFGDCYGVMLMYSGNHKTAVELDQVGSVRIVSGIHDTHFNWRLAPGECFETPEAILTFTDQGISALSLLYHRFLRNNVIRSRWNHRRRPVLINNWEATYFDFNSEKILNIARQAAELGVELFVLDDGWFGKRNSDNSSLGDWDVNEEKLPGGLTPLISQINQMGMMFGIWIEPEMTNEDSNLYRNHPDWAMTIPGRKPTMGRNQLVLDLSRKEVVDYLKEKFTALLRDHNIQYVKWDMNRNMTDVYSHFLPADRQGEVFHRYMLGVYDLLETLTSQFPEVLFEGCAGGGGRFDAAMLSYFPQIWCSDNTDAIERLTIQHGTSVAYPISVTGSHISACPNHQTGRTTPLETRAIVAMSGTFGYELDLNKLTEDEKKQVKEQIQRFHRYYDLIQNGNYYRLTNPVTNQFYTVWQFAAQDGSEALLNVVVTQATANPAGIHFKLKGLTPDALYQVDEIHYDGFVFGFESVHMDSETHLSHCIYGSSLMKAGYTLPQLFGNYPSVQLHFVRK